MTQQPSRPAAGPAINLRGAVDLSALASRPAPRPRPASPAGAATSAPGAPPAQQTSGLVLEVTEETFGDEVVQRSMSVPVVVLLASARTPASAELAATLEQVAAQDPGAFLLAVVDVDASPQIAAAFQVQQAPALCAVLKGQPLPLFQGVYPPDQVQQVLDEVLRVAQANGVTGRADVAAAPPGEQPEDVEPPMSPLEQEAYEAVGRDDYDAAAAAYRTMLQANPADELAAAGLAQVEVLRRVQGVDGNAARSAADAAPADVAAQVLAADVDFVAGRYEVAFARLVDTVRRTSGDDRAAARAHLVELFALVEPGDPRVAKARTALANALF
jgi:putative thioredoxin